MIVIYFQIKQIDYAKVAHVLFQEETKVADDTKKFSVTKCSNRTWFQV